MSTKVVYQSDVFGECHHFDQLDEWVMFTVNREMFDALPGKLEIFNRDTDRPDSKDVWVKSVNNSHYGVSFRTFDPPPTITLDEPLNVEAVRN